MLDFLFLFEMDICPFSPSKSNRSLKLIVRIVHLASFLSTNLIKSSKFAVRIVRLEHGRTVIGLGGGGQWHPLIFFKKILLY